ncbi:synaptotagmin-2-like [Odontomachus brunneus]|uniref:synaptotagmin-2-like n=1 Tax=Odontomachus brunneus TaxID=486640 RepID=UPI0013F2747F|nr:synaptotagmin-2-like [Odontomachus brunneus]XP_032672805.1 synaptotagmin-2-like [Odontomachus brunneus]XP_032672814.1 synaptotagmin-2-like [Odontomachus brunneus]XP_032672824.1 synaptotagmin-2-like [Odontomachus brunneus]XP_032672830.1 synaptotagmin-2-like [Odontomachus brunneus]XP_032672839.1 synaptotagmin-2-like [Odontomachus brunneus]XP_032672847.1 synaptotagmin-2-like [Odontomachus brunneus]
MDVHGAGVVAVLGTVGAATGAISAVIVYTICARRRRLPLLTTGPLNWFERDLLDRAEEAARSSKDVLVGLGSGVALSRDNKISRRSNSQSDDDEWQSDHVFDSIASDSPRRVRQHLSESDDIPPSPMSPLAPPLPEGAVVASEKRMVIVRPPTRSIDGSHSRLNSVEIESAPRHKLSSSSSTSSSDEVRGELKLGLIYDENAGILTVRLIEAHDLRARELSGIADPYAKIRLLPDRSNVWQTTIHRRTLNPVFDEDFVFEVTPESSLAGRTLEILLYDFDAFTRHRGLGYVQLPLSSVPNLDMNLVTITKPVLRYGTEGGFKAPPLGELMVSISYHPSIEKLTIIVVRARNLPVLDDPANANPYVKVSLIQDGKSLKKKKSGMQREATSPVWNDILSFDISSDVLSKCILQFSVLRSNGDLLAKCEVSASCQRELFHRVLSGKGASAQWLPLSEPEAQRVDNGESKD